MCFAGGAVQGLKLGPGVEERLLTLLRERILPVALTSLRLWQQGDALLASSSPIAQHVPLGPQQLRKHARGVVWGQGQCGAIACIIYPYI